eukprot:m.645336 g.645336  ORF g.645336 m.645336 type:complete len:232 (-) comp22651_c0_seq9:3992-4687(-)
MAETHFKVLLFDLDETLYRSSTGIALKQRQGALRYMHEKLGVPVSECEAVWRREFQKTNQTAKALREAFPSTFDIDTYFKYSRIGYDLLHPLPIVRNFLHALPLRKMIFSNGSRVHVMNCLKRLDIADCFEGIISSDEMGHVCKPQADAFQIACRLAQVKPREAIFFDDNIKNIRGARSLGMQTVHICGDVSTQGDGPAHHVVQKVHQATHTLLLFIVSALHGDPVYTIAA